MDNLHKQWTISDNRDWFNEHEYFDTKEEAVEFGRTYEEFEGRSFYVGKVIEVEMKCGELAINVIEEIQHQHYNCDYEFAENYLDYVKKEHIKELDNILEKAILGWAEKYGYLPDYFKVYDIERVNI
jgi:hypothetical protein